MLKNFLSNESGTTVAEYGLVISAIGLILTITVSPLSTALKSAFIQVAAELN